MLNFRRFQTFRRLLALRFNDLTAASALSVAARQAFSAGDGKSTRASIIVSTQHRSEVVGFSEADRNTTGHPAMSACRRSEVGARSRRFGRLLSLEDQKR
jgi:hypothetical protein